MNDRKSTMHARSQGRHISGRHETATQHSELINVVQPAIHDEKNSLLFTRILSGLVWNG